MSEREIRGHCPSCGHASLFRGDGGYVTCSNIECSRPDAATDILADREIHHIVELTETESLVRHPLIERLDDALFDCRLHAEIAALAGPPRQSASTAGSGRRRDGRP